MGNSNSSEAAGATPSQPGFTPLTTKRPGKLRVSRLNSANEAGAAPLAPPLSPTADSIIIPEGGPSSPPGPGSFKSEQGKVPDVETESLATSEHQAATGTAASAPRQPQQQQAVDGAKTAAEGKRTVAAGGPEKTGPVYGAAYPPEMIEAMMQKEALKAGKGGGSARKIALEREGSRDSMGARGGEKRDSGEGGGEKSVVAEEEEDKNAEAEAGEGEAFRARKVHRNREKLEKVLEEPVTDLNALRTLCWSGCTEEHRPDTWRLLLRYMPGNRQRRLEKMGQLRHEYSDAVANYFDKYNAESASEYDRVMYNQIAVDLPRTNPSMLLFQSTAVHACLHRILYVWGIRHPGTGYVQGINDLVTPFFFVFLREATGASDAAISSGDIIHAVGPDVLARVEADCYHCLTSMLDNAQDNYVVDFKGIQEKVFRLKRIINRLDDKLVTHLENENVDFIQFAFRWFNCLLMREFSMECTLRLWDSYVADKQFASFHVYVCAAVLLNFSQDLKAMEFQDIIMFLQKLPTQDWDTEKMDMILAQAYAWAEQFSLNHM